MKASAYGRAVLGAAAVVYGVITFVWHDDGAWESLPILSLPLGAVIGGALALAQIAGGIALQWERTARPAAAALGIVYCIFTLACVPAIVPAPLSYGGYVDVFEWLSVACGAFALFAPRATRIGFGICTISFTLAQAIYFQITAGLVPAWIPPSPAFWTILTTIAFGLAAIAILINVQAQLALRLLTLMLGLFGLLVWVPQLVTHPEMHFNWAEFSLNYLITGAAWIVAASVSAPPRSAAGMYSS
jgi:hypothetical protein